MAKRPTPRPGARCLSFYLPAADFVRMKRIAWEGGFTYPMFARMAIIRAIDPHRDAARDAVATDPLRAISPRFAEASPATSARRVALTLHWSDYEALAAMAADDGVNVSRKVRELVTDAMGTASTDTEDHQEAAYAPSWPQRTETRGIDPAVVTEAMERLERSLAARIDAIRDAIPRPARHPQPPPEGSAQIQNLVAFWRRILGLIAEDNPGCTCRYCGGCLARGALAGPPVGYNMAQAEQARDAREATAGSPVPLDNALVQSAGYAPWIDRRR